ncbi:MAG: phage terminase large subunit, partial [Clostridia bacterium]|nr:phage terminase large subunit [Clostridia bacterium]
MNLQLSLSDKQLAFVEAEADEVLFGGAAGGGKSHAQLIDALLYALSYPRSRQLILRRTLPELEMSLVRCARTLYPASLFSFSVSAHSGRFVNGSLIDFGFCAGEGDVFRYQSAEYDVIRFDELTHFSEFQYLYLLSRLRGTNGYPKRVKSSTNPGGVGHVWVKRRFVDPAPHGQLFEEGGRTRLFIPARLDENPYLCRADPGYRARLLALPETQRRALLEGEWDLFEGRFFSEFSYETHTCPPFSVPGEWRRFRTVDYGLDCLACLWIALDPDGDAWVYRELSQKDLVVSRACEEMLRRTPPGETIYATLAPPDLWQRSQESGRSKALLFSEFGVDL